MKNQNRMLKFLDSSPKPGNACLAIACLILLAPASSWAIKKCQDADGEWHYGDFAAQECEEAVVSELNDSGVKIGEDAPPPSAAELRAIEAAAKQADQAAVNEAELRQRDEELLNIYGSEEIILSTRDRKLASIDNNVDVTRQIKAGILKDIDLLAKRKQTEKVKKLIVEREKAIKSYDRVINQNLSERAKLSEKYDQIMLQFRRASARKQARNAS